MTDAIHRLTAALADRYRLERELGQGGMGTVYLAHDLKHDRKVALKVLRPQLAGTVGPDRFLREIRIVAQLQHPHILPLLESGEADGFLYYVMPYVEGQSLRDRLTRQGELPIHEAVKLLSEVVDALSYAHGRGVVHRDVTPIGAATPTSGASPSLLLAHPNNSRWTRQVTGIRPFLMMVNGSRFIHIARETVTFS